MAHSYRWFPCSPGGQALFLASACVVGMLPVAAYAVWWSGPVGVLIAIVGGLIVCWGVLRIGLTQRARSVEQRLSATERDLLASETRLRLAMRSTGIGLWDYRPGEETVGSNDEVARMLGYAPETFTETRGAFVERLHPDDREGVRAAFRDYLQGRRPDYSCEFRMRTRAGDYRWFRSVGQIVERDAEGEPRRVVGTYLDITGQIESMRRLADLSGRLLAVQEAERGRLARELHDEFGQQLTAIKLNLHALGRELASDVASERLADCRAIVEQTLGAIRNRALDLRPPMLDDLGLYAALDWYCRRQQERSDTCVTLLAAQDMGRVSEVLETTIFRVVQEAVNNALRHAAGAQVTVTVVRQEANIRVEICDDGKGFDASKALNESGGFGLNAMKERVALAGGSLEILSGAGEGTRIVSVLPVDEAER
jgi:PAS domain S-box-containing protein